MGQKNVGTRIGANYQTAVGNLGRDVDRRRGMTHEQMRCFVPHATCWPLKTLAPYFIYSFGDLFIGGNKLGTDIVHS